MSHAARQRPDEPPPEPAPLRDLQAEAGALTGQARTLLARLLEDPSATQASVDELAILGMRLADVTAALRDEAAACRAGDANREVVEAIRQDALAEGIKIGEERAAARSKAHRHRKASGASASWRQGVLTPVKVLIPAAAAGAWAALKHSARHAPGIHAAAATAAAATIGLAAYTLVPSSASGTHGAASGAGASVPGWHTSATPIPSSSLIALLVTHPKAKHSAKGKLLLGTGLPVPYVPAPEPSSSSASASPSSSPVVSAQAGPATLSIGGVTSLDLTSGAPVTITVTATGSGWASWKVDASGSDLDFSPASGVLQAGQSAEVTVSVDQANLLDGIGSETFSIAGYSVQVSLPALVASVVPSPVASVVPSVLPSL